MASENSRWEKAYESYQQYKKRQVLAGPRLHGEVKVKKFKTTKVPKTYQGPKSPQSFYAPKAKKTNWKTMNREVKPRETEILHRLDEIRELHKRLKEEAYRLNEELSAVRKDIVFGKNKVMLYALRCQNDCWYIGMTFDVDRRFKKHSNGKGATWTKINKPIEIHETRTTEYYNQEEVARLEDEMTLEYARKYGIDKVRGGGYCQTKPRWPAELLAEALIDF